MNVVFPFGLQPAVTFYVILYIVTLVLHAVFAAYVLAGSLYVASVTLFPGSSDLTRTRQPVAAMLREWMPVMLSGAITAAVAPLLFIQILYRQQFYTANLLLGWRWLVVIPVLIVAFYLLYVLKSKAITAWPVIARGTLTVATAACFVFVAFCWSANHLLSIQADTWPDVSQTGSVIRSMPALMFRLATWITGMFPVMAVVVAMQLAHMETRSRTWNSQAAVSARSSLSAVSLLGLAVAIVCGTIYLSQLDASVRDFLVSAAGIPWLIVLAIGALAQVSGWLLYGRQSQFRLSMFALIPGGCLVMLLAAGCLREMIRIAQVDLASVNQSCAAAADIGGFGLFLIAAALTTVLAAGCVLITVRDLRGAATDRKPL